VWTKFLSSSLVVVRRPASTCFRSSVLSRRPLPVPRRRAGLDQAGPVRSGPAAVCVASFPTPRSMNRHPSSIERPSGRTSVFKPRRAGFSDCRSGRRRSPLRYWPAQQWSCSGKLWFSCCWWWWWWWWWRCSELLYKGRCGRNDRARIQLIYTVSQKSMQLHRRLELEQ